MQVAISAAVAWELVPHIMDYHTEEVAKALQNILICIEMFLAAIAHLFYYDYTDFYSASSRQLTPLAQMQLAELEFTQAAGHKRTSSTGATFTGTAGRPSRGASMSGNVAVAVEGGVDGQDDSDPYGTIKVPDAATATAAATPGGAGAAPHARTASMGGRSRSGTTQSGMHERTASTASAAAGGGGVDDGVTAEPHIVTPGFKAAMFDVLPVDIITETGEHLRTGFGLVHKWEKRRAEAAATAQFQSDVDAGKLGRSKPRSKFASDSAVGGDGAADATPSVDDATAAAPAAGGDGAAAAGPLSGFDASGDAGFNPLATPSAAAATAKA